MERAGFWHRCSRRPDLLGISSCVGLLAATFLILSSTLEPRALMRAKGSVTPHDRFFLPGDSSPYRHLVDNQDRFYELAVTMGFLLSILSLIITAKIMWDARR